MLCSASPAQHCKHRMYDQAKQCDQHEASLCHHTRPMQESTPPLSSLPMPGTGKHLDHPVASTCPLCVNACDGSTTIPIRSQRSLAYERSCTSLRNTQLLPAAHASHFPATNATTCPALLWHGWHCDGWCLQGMQHPGLEARQPAPAATVDPVLRTAPCCCHLGDTLPHVPHCLC
jgi:hypothetical protein